MSVFQYSALTISVILILFVVGWILHSLEGKPRASFFPCFLNVALPPRLPMQRKQISCATRRIMATSRRQATGKSQFPRRSFFAIIAIVRGTTSPSSLPYKSGAASTHCLCPETPRQPIRANITLLAGVVLQIDTFALALGKSRRSAALTK
jgi:hypothetical protein